MPCSIPTFPNSGRPVGSPKSSDYKTIGPYAHCRTLHACYTVSRRSLSAVPGVSNTSEGGQSARAAAENSSQLSPRRLRSPIRPVRTRVDPNRRCPDGDDRRRLARSESIFNQFGEFGSVGSSTRGPVVCLATWLLQWEIAAYTNITQLERLIRSNEGAICGRVEKYTGNEHCSFEYHQSCG